MKRTLHTLPFLALWLFSSMALYCQSHINIRNPDGSDRYVPLGSLQKITFDDPNNKINFVLTDAITHAVEFNALQRITSDDIGAGTLLPVVFATFSAAASHNSIVLSWKTATEINNYGFDIERRARSIEWEKVGFVHGYGTSNSPREYSFTDSPQMETKFQYRLKQIDADGIFQYSDIVSIDIGTPATYELKQNYPNPFNPQTTIVYKISTEGFVAIKVYDVLGKEVQVLVNENKKAGSYNVTFDGSRLASGVYFCRMNSAAHSSLTKMIIMK